MINEMRQKQSGNEKYLSSLGIGSSPADWKYTEIVICFAEFYNILPQLHKYGRWQHPKLHREI
jgi:hypothetical protein